ncbi:DUF4868 domain-containing protein [bacterium AH-315-C08]|nr:DUF4868 domain-containing protein [bacterium AH-315-C08]
MEELKKLFKKLKKHDWGKSVVSFYVVKRRLIERKAKYEVMQVNIAQNLQKKLREIANKKIAGANDVLEYDFNTTDLDDNVLGIPNSETDFEEILKVINAEEEPHFAKSYEDLLKTNLYISRLDIKGEQPLYAIRYVAGGWNAKKVTQFIDLIYKDNTLVDLDFKEIFRIDSKVDFLSFDGTIFIADKKIFETALNFRVGMESNRDEIVEEFKKLKLFDNPQSISELVGDNMRRLRRLSQVKKSGYYKNENFLENLKKINKKEGWGIQYSKDGKLIVTEDDIETVLRVLNNDRLTSQINKENFDVDVKHKIGGSP